MIFDCFLFFQEINLLKIRINYLYELVDKFIIVEANESFTGNKKEFVFEKNLNIFKDYIDKIYYFKIYDRHKDFKSLNFYLTNKKDKIYSKINSFINEHNYYDKEKLYYIL